MSNQNKTIQNKTLHIADRAYLWQLVQSDNRFLSERLKSSIANALEYITTLEDEVQSYKRSMENINQALNEGDGVYRP